MIVVMQQGAAKEAIDKVVQRVRDMGLKDNVIVGEERTVIAVIGDERFKDQSAFEVMEAVDKVVPILSPYKRASREGRPGKSVIDLGNGATVGGKQIPVIAGPCSVESRDGIIEIAHLMKNSGAAALRGGAFKPRTNPYSFQGMGEEGLKHLARAREETGLAIVTEVMSIDQVDLVCQYADVLQIGARNMQNFNLLSRVGETSKPVLLKRGMSATLEEFLLAAEYILARGNPNVILCERGIRTFEDYVRNTLPLAIVPALQKLTHLPIVVDPSHGTGKADLVEPMCRAAVAAGCDGLIIETHADPSKAMTDGAQSLTPAAFAVMMKSTARVAAAVDRVI
ncbi:MAG TPA: 3-deoxy-7-phosphoheptulonate synthase [Tepidisphaeraceae bacterium]